MYDERIDRHNKKLSMLDNYIKGLDEMMSTEEGKKLLSDAFMSALPNPRFANRKKKVFDYCESLSIDEFGQLYERVRTKSQFLRELVEYAYVEYGKPYTHHPIKDEDFLGGRYAMKGYYVNIYYGQGDSFTQAEHDTYGNFDMITFDIEHGHDDKLISAANALTGHDVTNGATFIGYSPRSNSFVLEDDDGIYLHNYIAFRSTTELVELIDNLRK